MRNPIVRIGGNFRFQSPKVRKEENTIVLMAADQTVIGRFHFEKASETLFFPVKAEARTLKTVVLYHLRMIHRTLAVTPSVLVR